MARRFTSSTLGTGPLLLRSVAVPRSATGFSRIVRSSTAACMIWRRSRYILATVALPDGPSHLATTSVAAAAGPVNTSVNCSSHCQ